MIWSLFKDFLMKTFQKNFLKQTLTGFFILANEKMKKGKGLEKTDGKMVTSISANGKMICKMDEEKTFGLMEAVTLDNM